MTAWADRLRIGKSPPNANAFANQPPQSGAPTTPQFVYTCTPITASNNKIALQQTVAAGGTFVLTAGSGATTVTIGGLSCIDLGSARLLQYVNNTASAVAAVVTVSGYEETVLADGTMGPGQAMSEQTTMNASQVAKTGKKSFRYIQQVFTATNTVSGASIGIVDTFGMPIAITDGGDLDIFWNGASALTASGGITLADTTAPATSLTGDVRGTWGPPPSPSTGSRILTAYIFVRNPDTLAGVYGQPQQ